MFPVTTVRDVNQQVGEIKAVFRRLLTHRALRDPLHDAHPDLTGPQIHLIACLATADDGMPTTALAQRMCASGPTLTGLVDRLEKQGLVTRERDDDDRRLVRLHLTDAGRQAFAILDGHMTERMGRVLEALEPDDRETFVRLMGRIADAFAEKTPP